MFNFDPTITVSLVISVATVVFAWFRTRRHDVDKRFSAGSEKLADLEKRLGAIEIMVLSLPDKDDMHSLQRVMLEMAGDMKAMRATMRALGESVARQEAISARHEDYMRDNK